MDPPPLVTIEAALERLGGFSWFQILATSVILLAEIPTAMIVLVPIFTGTNNVHFLCETHNDTTQMMSSQDPAICGLQCMSADNPVTSIVQEWGLICDQAWVSDFIASIQMVGMMTGAILSSQLADRFGRKRVFFTVLTTMGTFGVISGVVNDVYTYGTMRYLTGVGLGGFYIVYFIFLMEFLTPAWRTIAGCLTLWSVGIMFMALLAYLLPAWRHLTWATSGAALVVLIFYPFLPETPRWLLCKEKTKEAEKSFQTIAKMNRKPPLDSHTIQELQMSVLKEVEQEKQNRQSTFEIFRNPELRHKLLIFMFGWYAVTVVYYSMSYNTKNLAGNPCMNVFYMGLVDLPAYPSAIWFNNKFGRRKTYAGYLVFAAIFIGALLIVDLVFGSEGRDDLISVLTYVARFGVAGAWGVVTCFTAESFPTVCRSTALGVCALMADVGGVLGPQLAFLGSISPSTPYFIFAGLIVTAAFSPCLLQETNRKPLQNFA